MFNFSDNRKSINEIYTMFKKEQLVVDSSYQRRSVWSEKDKIRLIETILLKLVVPVLFFWKADTNPETGESLTHIVDGQQRIKAIYSFINNEFKLKPQFLLDSSIRAKFAGMSFNDLPPEVKVDFWNYPLMVIDIDANASRDDIVTMFNRLNLTDYNLNDQEKRNSMSGEFASLARELSNASLWEDKHLFTITDVKRMKDVEFCASLILLFRKGIIDQTDQTPLNQAYEELQVGYQDAEKDKEGVFSAIEIVPQFFVSENATKFLKKKTQLYTLFCVIFYMQRTEINVTAEHTENFARFVDLYSIFNNETDISEQLDDHEKLLFDKLKKYKLASSEGLNKHTNRMIRYNVLKDFIFGMNAELITAATALAEKMSLANDAESKEHVASEE